MRRQERKNVKKMAFSPRMEPPELAIWLLDFYGEAYRDDVEKLKRAKINGELFLELPDDEESLKRLNLSPSFKRLVKNKVKELKQSDGAVDNILKEPSSDQDNARAGSATTTCTVREPSVTVQAQAQPMAISAVLSSTELVVPMSVATKVPFLFREVITITDEGKDYTIDSHDVSVRFPFGAVAKGQTLQIEIGIALYGPFKSTSRQPISPIVWLCPLDEKAFKLDKPFQLILPHFLSGDKVHSHQVGFAKANHSTYMYEENRYIFRKCDAEPTLVSTGNKNFGILQAYHCCFYCLEANKSHQIAKDAGYTLVRLESVARQEVNFCTIYALNTCLKSLTEQFPPEEGYRVAHCYDFKFNDRGMNFIKIVTVPMTQCIIAMDPSSAEIKESDINFWGTKFEILKFKHQVKTYPPRVTMSVSVPSDVHRTKLPVQVEGCTGLDQMEIQFPLRSNDVEGSHHQSSVTSIRSITILTGCGDIDDIEHHHLSELKWKQHELGREKHLRLYSRVAHKWEQIAAHLGFTIGEIESIRRNCYDDHGRITTVLGRWSENAKNLPNASKYPKSWQGLINLLEDVELGEVGVELKRALTSQKNSVRGNLS